MSNDMNGTPDLSVERMVRDDLQTRLGAAARELADIAAMLRQRAADLNEVGSRSQARSYVGVCVAAAGEMHTRVADLRLERLAVAALQADLDRAKHDGEIGR